ncbi:hypothetical protein [Paenirhodobacter sp.]|uniref:hypothetical protein n=1 Tax=Paenirhodobacter sp. TaxID=1965326 RepID=UPI003B415ABF
MRGKEARPFPLEELPVDQRREFHQLMTGINHVGQARAQQVILFGGREWGFIDNLKVQGFWPKHTKS